MKRLRARERKFFDLFSLPFLQISVNLIWEFCSIRADDQLLQIIINFDLNRVEKERNIRIISSTGITSERRWKPIPRHKRQEVFAS